MMYQIDDATGKHSNIVEVTGEGEVAVWDALQTTVITRCALSELPADWTSAMKYLDSVPTAKSVGVASKQRAATVRRAPRVEG